MTRQNQSLTDRLQRFAPQTVVTPIGQVGYRQSGAQHISHVLLHGIGSASGSWLMQLEAANTSQHTPNTPANTPIERSACWLGTHRVTAIAARFSHCIRRPLTTLTSCGPGWTPCISPTQSPWSAIR